MGRDARARAITPPRGPTTVRERTGETNLRCGAEGKNYERNATGHRATPNLICPHPRPPLGFANKITLKDIEGTRGVKAARGVCRQSRLGAITSSLGLYQPLSRPCSRFNTDTSHRVSYCFPSIFLWITSTTLTIPDTFCREYSVLAE